MLYWLYTPIKSESSVGGSHESQISPVSVCVSLQESALEPLNLTTVEVPKTSQVYIDACWGASALRLMVVQDKSTIQVFVNRLRSSSQSLLLHIFAHCNTYYIDLLFRGAKGNQRRSSAWFCLARKTCVFGQITCLLVRTLKAGVGQGSSTLVFTSKNA